MAFFDVETMGGAGRRSSNKRNPLHFGRGAGAYTTETMGGKMVEGSGIFSGLLGAIGLGEDEMGGYAKGYKLTDKEKKSLALGREKVRKLAVKLSKEHKQKCTRVNRKFMPNAKMMELARQMIAAKKANKSTKGHKLVLTRVKNPRVKKMKIPKIIITEEGGYGVGGYGVGGYAVGGLDSGEKRFLRGINNSPAQAELANTYGELAENYGGMSHNKLGMVHKKDMHMLPHMDGSGIFSSLLGSLGLGVNEHNLALLQQLEHKIEEQLPLQHKGAGRMLIHHVMRNRHGKRSLKGAGWFDDIVDGFTSTIKKIIPLVPAIIPLVQQFMG